MNNKFYQPIFRKEWYFKALKKGPISLFKRLFLDIKWAKQRIQRGYSDYDACDIECFLEYLIPSILIEYKELENQFDTSYSSIIYNDKFFDRTLDKYHLSQIDYIKRDIDNSNEKLINSIDKELHNHWIQEIDNLIYLFIEMNEDECSMKNKYKDKKLTDYCDEKRKEAFVKLNYYFCSLWH